MVKRVIVASAVAATGATGLSCIKPEAEFGLYGYKFDDLASSIADDHEIFTSGTVKCSADSKQGVNFDATVQACTEEGGAFTLSGCEEMQCLAADDAANYKVDTTTLDANPISAHNEIFTGSAGCVNADFETGASVAVTKCSADQEKYTVTGCKDPATITCTAPAAGTAGYRLVNDAAFENKKKNEIYASSDITCESGFVGTPAIEKCNDDGEYTLTGCETKKCTKPNVDGYTADTTDLGALGNSIEAGNDLFTQTITCADGYSLTEGTSKASIGVCSTHNTEFTLMGCKLDVYTCTTPTSVEGYVAKSGATDAVWPTKDANTTSDAALFSHTISCAAGYEKAADKDVAIKACSEDNKPFELVGCVKTPFQCKKPDNVAHFKGLEAKDYKSNDDIFTNAEQIKKIECAANAQKKGEVTIKPCEGADKPYVLEGCNKKNLGPSSSDAAGPAAGAVVRVAVLMLSAFTYLKM